jgi:regulatory protein
MKITALKQQVKRPDRYSVYIDGTYSCAFSEAEVLRLGLHTGQELNQAELDRLKADSTKDKARYQALGQIARRPRSEWELRDYLKRKAYAPELVDAVIEDMASYGYVDDRKFAEAWVHNRRLLKPTSQRRLQQELRQKRVADEVIAEVLAEDDTDDQTVLRELVERKRRQTKYQDDTKLIQYLIRQGYNYGDVKTVLQDESL